MLKGRDLPILAPRQYQFITVPKRPGAIHAGTTTDMRILDVPVLIKRPSNMTFPQLKEDLATWLTTEQAAPLRFDDDLDRVYFALLNSIDDLDIINKHTATTTIRFICPDPYKYSDEKPLFIANNTLNTFHNVDNLGNIDTYPIIKLDVKRQLNYFSAVSEYDILQIGQAKALEIPTYEPETLIFWDQMNTTLGWTQATYVDNGYVQGTIESDGFSFSPATYGEVIKPPKWQGPSLKKSIGKSLKNFRMEARVDLWNKSKKTGMLEIYLLNAANQTVAKIGIEDRWEEADEVWAKARVGGNDYGSWMTSGTADKVENWNNFVGVLRIERNDKRYTAYISTIDPNTGEHLYPRGTNGSIFYYDNDGQYESDITQVQVAFRIYPDSQRAVMKVHDIKIWELNKPIQPEAIPIIAQAGDTLEIDHYKNTVRRNGEIVMGLKDFASNFFPLKPGRNRIAFSPSDAGDVTITHRERYL